VVPDSGDILADRHTHRPTDILIKILRNRSRGHCKVMIKFWWRSGSEIWIWIGIVTLARCVLVEICIVPVLLVTSSIARSANLPVFNLLRGRF